ncbi:MAG: YcaO-like family protein [Acidobacteriota bacterium]
MPDRGKHHQRVPPAATETIPLGRTRSLEETEGAVLRIQNRIPISRISDLTPLDRLGLPVYSVTTPLARDLTTHLGKGMDDAAARVSALMEAVERVSAEEPPPGTVEAASFHQLTGRGELALDAEDFDLPTGSTWDRESEFNWVPAELRHWGRPSERALLPADLAISPPREGLLDAVDTNGLAAGNDLVEAAVHGVCEVVERDAQGQLEFQGLHGGAGEFLPKPQVVDPTSLPAPAATWVSHIEDHGLSTVLHDLTGDIRVPGFRALILDPAYPTPTGLEPRVFAGWGTSLNPGVAVMRAVSEAVQSRLGVVQGARDAWNATAFDRRAATREGRLQAWRSEPEVAFEDTAAARAADTAVTPAEKLEALQERLAAVGLERLVIVDLTRPDLDIAVVRVRVPGLSSFLVNRRRVGWRCLRHLL